jgi:hypothetical protein
MEVSQIVGLVLVSGEKLHGETATGLFQLSGNDRDSYTLSAERDEYYKT